MLHAKLVVIAIRHTFVLAALSTSYAFAQETSTSSRDVVVVQTGGEYVSYPAAKVERRTSGVSRYTIDMTTALSPPQEAEAQDSILMTWRPSSGSKHTLCFEHNGGKVCRDLSLQIDVSVAPRFKPTHVGVLPTVYVRFVDASGDILLIEYSDGTILTMAEVSARLDNPLTR